MPPSLCPDANGCILQTAGVNVANFTYFTHETHHGNVRIVEAITVPQYVSHAGEMPWGATTMLQSNIAPTSACYRIFIIHGKVNGKEKNRKKRKRGKKGWKERKWKRRGKCKQREKEYLLNFGGNIEQKPYTHWKAFDYYGCWWFKKVEWSFLSVWMLCPLGKDRISRLYETTWKRRL